MERQELGAKHAVQILELLEQNTRLTRELSERIKALTGDVHRTVLTRP